MTEDDVQMSLDIAGRILADSGSSDDRKAWASDVVLALDKGDAEAAARIGFISPQAA